MRQDTMANITLQTIFEQFREDVRNNRDLGDRFERLMPQFLRTDPLYAAMWNEWPVKAFKNTVLLGR